MDQGFQYLTTAARYGEARLAVVSNNLANVNTPGFKADRLAFSEVLDGANRSVQMSQYTDFDSGAIQTTGNPLDVAIDGEGFFVVDTPDGQQYTRDGGFQLGSDGMLVTASGFPVLGDGGPLLIDPQVGQVSIRKDGTVSANGIQVGRLSIVRFDKAAPPIKAGGNLWSGQGEIPVDNPQVVPGAIERANVEAIQEMTRMIEISRGYETYQKMIQTMDQVAGQTNELGTV